MKYEIYTSTALPYAYGEGGVFSKHAFFYEGARLAPYEFIHVRKSPGFAGEYDTIGSWIGLRSHISKRKLTNKKEQRFTFTV